MFYLLNYFHGIFSIILRIYQHSRTLNSRRDKILHFLSAWCWMLKVAVFSCFHINVRIPLTTGINIKFLVKMTFQSFLRLLLSVIHPHPLCPCVISLIFTCAYPHLRLPQWSQSLKRGFFFCLFLWFIVHSFFMAEYFISVMVFLRVLIKNCIEHKETLEKFY